MVSTFARFPPRLQEAIVSRLGWTSLRPVQELAGAAILDGSNAVVLAPTAGGKTEASIFPVLAHLMAHPPEAVGALYLAPIKALLNNQEERLGTYTEMVGLRRFVWHGDTRESAKRSFLREPAELLMTTPESLEVMLASPRVPAERLFSGLSVVVVDEVHAFAGTDRGAHLMSVLERLAMLSGGDIQRIGLSATVGNPEAILAWIAGSSQRAGVVVEPPKQPKKRQLQVILCPTTHDLATRASSMGAGKKSLFFCQSRALSETVAERMRGRGIDVFVHHSSVALEERQAAEESFQSGANACIVCTSTLELGIDVGDLDLVFQANAPTSVSSFLQRMGRTGRRDDKPANATFLCETGESVLQAIAIIELARRGWVESVPVSRRCWPVMAHQILAQTLQYGAISAERCHTLLSKVPDFADISRAEYDGLVAHMLASGYLLETGGMLTFGPTAERVFGRKNFMELYAVFSSPVLYRVRTPNGRDLGSLEQAFVDRLVGGITSFLLAGRAWLAESVDHKDRIVRVIEAPKGKEPSWGGFLPQFLSFPVCRAMRDVVMSTDRYPYADEQAMAAVEEWRADLGETLHRSPYGLRETMDTIEVWTFAGGQINATLRAALEAIWNVKAVSGNLNLRVSRQDNDVRTILKAFQSLSKLETWENTDLRRRFTIGLPAYRLSKFQDALPPEAAWELIAANLLDEPGTIAYLNNPS